MKSFIRLLVTLGLVISFWQCSESINQSEPENEIDENVNYSNELKNLFPAEIGDSFNYLVDTLNLQNNSFENIGSRILSVSEKESISNVYICSEKYEIFNSILQSQSKFRINENYIEFFYDSNGVANVIPDSLDIKLTFDESFKLVEYPYEKGKKWSTFKGVANFGTFKFEIFSITGQYLGSEAIQLEGFESVSNTEKFKYEITLNIPDISNPFISNIQQYSTTLWFLPEEGIVKLEGCGMFLNTITGRNFNIEDSNKVIRHTLVADN